MVFCSSLPFGYTFNTEISTIRSLAILIPVVSRSKKTMGLAKFSFIYFKIYNLFRSRTRTSNTFLPINHKSRSIYYKNQSNDSLSFIFTFTILSDKSFRYTIIGISSINKSSSLSSFSNGRNNPGRVGSDNSSTTFSDSILERISRTKGDLKPIAMFSPSY